MLKTIKKSYSNEFEKQCLVLFQQSKTAFAPRIQLKKEHYLIEYCEIPKKKNFSTEKILELLKRLNNSLYQKKSCTFCDSLYKYIDFQTNENSYKKHIQHYLNFLISKVSEKGFKKEIPDLFKIDFEPKFYSLIHGDLHIGNIVSKNNELLLIDYEYLKYGEIEIEISNLIFSLIKNDCPNFELGIFLYEISKNSFVNLKKLEFYNKIIFMIELLKSSSKKEINRTKEINKLIKNTTANTVYK